MIDEATIAAAWDENAESWTAQVRAGRDVYREVFNNPMFMAFVPPLAGLDVIDLGCGEGRNTRLFAQRGARISGVDLSARFIAAARAAERAEPLGIRYEHGSFTTLDGVEQASFDVAVSTMAMMSTPDFSAAARSVHRVLRSSGRFYFSVIHPCFNTRGYRWLRDDQGSEEGLVVADYFSREPYWERWSFGKAPVDPALADFTVAVIPYRLEDYINGLCEAGFRILRIAEPRPTEAMVAEHPWLARLQRHAPIFLYFASAKEAA